MATELTLLGVAPADCAAALARGLAALDGPAPVLHRAGRIVGVAQRAAAPRKALLLARDRAGLLGALLALQRRLELACQIGPFLPADPQSPSLPQAELAMLLDEAAPALEAALARDGERHQWDVILRWPAPTVLEPHRAGLAGLPRAALAGAVADLLATEREARRAALRSALHPAVLAIAEADPVGEDAACAATVVVPRAGEAAIEAALAGLPDTATRDAAAELRGPLPPLAFSALRVADVASDTVRRAWMLLGLRALLASVDRAATLVAPALAEPPR
jgi:hypothetical protein